jgi:hypothetical protein
MGKKPPKSTVTPSKPRGWFGEGHAALIAAVIGLVSAVITVVVPMMYHEREPEQLPSEWYIGGGDKMLVHPPTGPEFQLAKEAAALEAAKKVAADVRATHNLTLGVWTLFDSTDDEGNLWNNSTLKFTKQVPVEGGVDLEGFFEWRSYDQTVGIEYVRAHFDTRTHQLFIEGQRTEPADRLAVGSFAAEVTPDGRQLLKGTWGSTPGNLASVPGKWNARR